MSASGAQAQAAGFHLGVDIDHGNLHLGGDVLVPLAELSPSVRLSVWPSFAHVIIDGGNDVELLGCDFPFELRTRDSVVSPYLAPGLGLAIQGDARLKLNVIVGTFFETGSSVRPFVELAIRLIQGTYADLLAGVLFEL